MKTLVLVFMLIMSPINTMQIELILPLVVIDISLVKKENSILC